MSFQDILEWLHTAAWSKIYLAEKQWYSTYEWMENKFRSE